MPADRDDARAQPLTHATDDAARGGSTTEAAEETARARALQSPAAAPSLVASELEAGTEGLGGASDRPPEARGESERALSGGRVDAASATVGGRESGTRGARAGGGPNTSVGAPEGELPGEPALDETDDRQRVPREGAGAGVLEDAGGRVGAEAAGGELYDASATGRSLADAAAASADDETNRP